MTALQLFLGNITMPNTPYTMSSFSFRSGIVEQKEQANGRENRLPRGNVTRASRFQAAGEFRAR